MANSSNKPMRLAAMGLALTCLCGPIGASAQPSLLAGETKVMASDGAASDRFGFGLSLDGDTAAVGAHQNGPGAVYIYERDAGGPGSWGEVKKLVDSGLVDDFGAKVSLSGDTLAVRSDGDGVYIFERDEGGPDNWGEVTKFGGTFSGDLALDGDTLIVGDLDTALIYGRDVGGADSWGQIKLITGASVGAVINSAFGLRVSIDGDTAAVAATADGGAEFATGAVYVFERDLGGTDNWGLVTKRTASDGEQGDKLGLALTLRGDRLVAGAATHDPGGNHQGAAYLFERDQGGAENWGEVRKLLPSSKGKVGLYGSAVGVSGDTIVIGARYDENRNLRAGALYVYQRDLGGGEAWGQAKLITATDATGNEELGESLAVSGTTVLGGASGDAGFQGAAYIFDDDAFCDPTPAGCAHTFPNGTVSFKQTSTDKEQTTTLMKKGPALSQLDLGDPLALGGTGYTACVYDDANLLVGSMKIDRAGSSCRGQFCFKPVGDSPPNGKGWLYRDRNRSADGTLLISLRAGTAGKSKIKLKAIAETSKGQNPQGITAALHGSTSVTVQLHGDDLASCFSATLDQVKKDTGTIFVAKK